MPPNLDKVHPVLHESMLKKYIPDESHILEHQVLDLDQDLTYREQPITIIDRDVRKLRSNYIPSVRVVWQHHKNREATWEPENVIRQQYPHLFDYG